MFFLVALLAAGLAGTALAGEKIQFSGRTGPGKSGGLQPESKPAFATPDFFNGPRLGGNPAEGLQPAPVVPYAAPRDQSKEDKLDPRKDWVFGERDDRDGRPASDVFLERAGKDRNSAETRPRTTMEWILNEQERRRLPVSGSATNDVLTSRDLTDSLNRPSFSLNTTNRAGAFDQTSGTLTNSSGLFQTGIGPTSLPGGANQNDLVMKDGKLIPQLQFSGTGNNAGFINPGTRMDEFKKMLNSGGNVLSFGGPANSPGERGVPGGAGSVLPGGRGIGELPGLSGQRKGFDFGGSFGNAATGRPATLNDLGSMRLGTPAQLPPPLQPAQTPQQERKPVSMEIPKRKF